MGAQPAPPVAAVVGGAEVPEEPSLPQAVRANASVVTPAMAINEAF
jgi:hypothetical protein